MLNMLYTLRFFSLRNAVCFIMLTCLIPVLLTFYIQDVLKLKKNNSGVKRLMWCCHEVYCHGLSNNVKLLTMCRIRPSRAWNANVVGV